VFCLCFFGLLCCKSCGFGLFHIVPSVLEGVFVCFLRLVFLASEFVFLYLEIVFQFVFFLECKLRVVQ
jgi:hypothetical protein